MKNNSHKPMIEDLTRLSLINNLKQKIEHLKQQVQAQKKVIQTNKRSTKATLINEQQIEIQKLNDENKRLLLIIEQIKSENVDQHSRSQKISKIKARLSMLSTNNKSNSLILKKKQNVEEWALENNKGMKREGKKKQMDFESKYYELIKQNDKIRKQLLVLKANQNLTKIKKPLNERSSILMENNINQFDKVRQKNYELEAELQDYIKRNTELKDKVSQLEELLEKALQINKSMKII